MTDRRIYNGGARRGAGRPGIEGGHEVRVTLSPEDFAYVKALGEGTASEGVRRALVALREASKK